VTPSLRLFGRPRVEVPVGTGEPAFGKAWALLLVLARRGEWVQRGELVYLFWPDHDEAQARANLRKLLSRNLAAMPLAQGLEAEPSRLRWLVETDVRRFEEAVASGRLAQALDLYRGPFLDGVRADALPEFEAWVEQERETLAAAWRRAGTTLAAQAALEGRTEDAAQVLESLVAADPFDEEALQGYLQALAAAGRPAAGLVTYRAFAERLEREYGETPSAETRAIAETLAATTPARRLATPAVHQAATPRLTPRALPGHPTPLVGRVDERREVARRLRDEACRLVTITGPGGFGKTRLASAVAADLRESFRDGVGYVPFTTVSHRDAVPFALAEALGVAVTGTREADDQLAEVLAAREMLLVFDDLEHLADDVAWLEHLVTAAPGLRVLATSREQLGVAGGCRYELHGLSLPDGSSDPRDAEAVQLFLETAARHDAEAAGAAPIDDVVRLCRTVDGMPLALVLAAGWVGTLGVDELIDELRRDLGVLSTSRPDVPERQRSLVAVFESSLARLSDGPRRVFPRLGAFAGSFDRQAASAVAGAEPGDLRELVARSVLGSAGTGRFRLHELLRQEAVRRLARDPEALAATRAAHARYYAAWLAAVEPELLGRTPAATLTQLDLERDNVVAAFRTAVSARDLETVERMATGLETYFVQRTHYGAGATLFEEAAAALGEDAAVARTTGAVWVRAGWLEFRRGRFDDAQALADRASRLLQGGGRPEPRIACERLWGALKGTRGDFGGAWDHLDGAVAMARAAGLPAQVAIALNDLAIDEKQLGLYRQAEAHYREALVINRERGSAFHEARNLNNLGQLLLADDRIDEATSVLEEGLTLARRAAAQQVVPHILGGLAKAALARGESARARATADEAWRAIRSTGARGSSVAVLVTLALAAAALGDHAGADHALAAAVADAGETQGPVAKLTTLAGVGRVRALRGDHHAAVMGLSLVREDPALEHSVRSELGPAWREAVRALGSEAVAEARAEAAALGVEGVLARLLPPMPRERA
jgi:predicted ATPase/DNA-binding SARP family transcriptional activator